MARGDYPTNPRSTRRAAPRPRQDAYEEALEDDAYDQMEESPYAYADEGYEDDGYEEDAAYDEPVRAQRSAPRARPPRPRAAEPAVISTNPIINLTCALAAVLGLMGLFLYFADKRSVAVRRVAVQSACLFVVNCFMTAILWTLAFILSSASLWGNAFWIIWVVYFVITFALRWQLAIQAYQGRAYILPLVGEFSRRFE